MYRVESKGAKYLEVFQSYFSAYLAYEELSFRGFLDVTMRDVHGGEPLHPEEEVQLVLLKEWLQQVG